MTPYLQDPDVTLYHGDALDVLRSLPDRSVHMCATSPPFYGLRDYGTGEWEGGDEGCDHTPEPPEPILYDNGQGQAYTTNNQNWNKKGRQYQGNECPKCGARRVDRQIGLEETPDQWVERLVAVFREVRRVLRDDGTLWVEIGDSYASGSLGDSGRAGATALVGNTRTNEQHRTPVTPGLKPKDLLGQPWLLARALQQPYYTGRIRDERDRVWLAAIIDGEGCMHIHKRPAGTPAYSKFKKSDGTEREYVRKSDSYQPKLEISNTNRAILERVVAITGHDPIREQTPQQNDRRKQTIYRWTVTADKCRDLLREVYPHLVGKQHEARLAIGCPSSGDKAAAAHEALKQLHAGNPGGIDFSAPESMFEAGWYLRSEIIWARRPNPMPESVTDRPTKSHSTVFLLSKSPRYFYDADAIREPLAPDNGYVRPSKIGVNPKYENSEHKANHLAQQTPNPAGANARSVWQIPTEPTPFAHFATWPRKLVARMILAGTSERGCCPECGAPWLRDVDATPSRSDQKMWRGAESQISKGLSRPGNFVDASRITTGWRPSCHHPKPYECGTTVEYGETEKRCTLMAGHLGPHEWGHEHRKAVPCTVLDPFAGSGTTCLVARNHGRRSIGIELNEQYLKIAADRLSQLSLLAEGTA